MTTTTGTEPARRPPPSERRNRALDALIDLVLERGEHPRPEEVAERADVSIASLYRYFTDLDELRRDAVTRVVERFQELFDISNLGAGDRGQRITSFTAARFELHEALHPLQLLSHTTSNANPVPQKHLASIRAAMTDQIERHFADELGTLRATRRQDTVATIATLTSVESWEQFRRRHGRTPAQTRRAWTFAIDRILPGT